MHDSIRQARDTLARLDNVEAEFAAENEIRNARHVQMWDVPADQRRAAQEREEIPQVTEHDDWNHWAEQHVQQGLARAADILGEEVGKVEAKLLKRIRVLEHRVGELVAEQTVARAATEIVDKNGAA